MSTAEAILLNAALSLMPAPSPAWNESGEAFRARMELIAESVQQGAEEAAPRASKREQRQLALAVVTVFWAESRFSPLVHSGERRGDGGRAICMGQLHRLSLSQAEWLATAGTDAESTYRCAFVTASRLHKARHYCAERTPGASYAEAFVLYGTGRTCDPEQSKWKSLFEQRARRWWDLDRRYGGREVQS